MPTPSQAAFVQLSCCRGLHARRAAASDLLRILSQQCPGAARVHEGLRLLLRLRLRRAMHAVLSAAGDRVHEMHAVRLTNLQ